MLRKSYIVALAFVATLIVLAVAPAFAQDDLPREETLVLSIGNPVEDPTNLNIYAPGVSRSGTGLHQMIYEYFFYVNLSTNEFIPWLATDFSYNDDATVLTVNLRDGVTWSDGEVFNAEDVIFTYETLLATPGMVWASEVIANIESVDAPDDLTVNFNLINANPRLHLNREAFPAVGIWGGITILPEHIWASEDPLTFKNSDPIGTSAYSLSSASQNAMIYERNDDWWGVEVFGQLPAPRFVSFEFVGPESNVALALADNELDLSAGTVSFSTYLEIASRNDAIRSWSEEQTDVFVQDPCPRVLMMQNGRAPLDQTEVRRAVSFYVNRDAYNDLFWEGAASPTGLHWPEYAGLQPFAEAVADIVEDNRVGVFDPAAGDALMEEAGFSKDGEMWINEDGSPVTLEFLTTEGSLAEATIIADQLEVAGFDVTVNALSGATQADARLRGEYDLAINAFCPGYIYENLELHHGKFFVELGEPAPWFERNSFRYANDELDAILDQMQTLDPADQAAEIELYRQAVEILVAEMPTTGLVNRPAIVPINETFWTNWPSAENPWSAPWSWWATFNLVLTGYPDAETGEWIDGIQPADM